MPTHGSMTKAGKVRNATPKIESQHKKKSIPKLKKFKNYKIRILYKDENEKRRERTVL